MFYPPVPPIPGAVGVNHHDLIGAVGQVVPVTLAATGPVGVSVCLAAARLHVGITHTCTGSGVLHSALTNAWPRAVSR